jgi:hypothetical protein
VHGHAHCVVQNSGQSGSSWCLPAARELHSAPASPKPFFRTLPRLSIEGCPNPGSPFVLRPGSLTQGTRTAATSVTEATTVLVSAFSCAAERLTKWAHQEPSTGCASDAHVLMGLSSVYGTQQTETFVAYPSCSCWRDVKLKLKMYKMKEFILLAYLNVHSLNLKIWNAAAGNSLQRLDQQKQQ